MRLAFAFSLLAAPALAQDTSAQYESALNAFVLPSADDLSMSGLMDEAPIERLLPSLQGDWVSANTLFPARGAFDTDLLAETCGRAASALAIIGPRSFEMRRTTEREGETLSIAIRHDFVVGNTFDRSVPEAEAMAYMGLDSVADPAPGMLMFAGLRGEVTMFHPSPDILVFVMPRAQPEILARCPA